VTRHPRPQPAAGLMLLVVVGYAAVGGCLGGCAATQGGQSVANPLQQTVAARETYTGTLAALNAAHRLGYLGDDDKAAIEPYRKAAAAGLNKMEAAALSGDGGAIGGDFAAALAGFNAALTELARYRIQADRAAAAVDRVRAAQPKAARAAPTTAPTR
jgi:hypothetical protein